VGVRGRNGAERWEEGRKGGRGGGEEMKEIGRKGGGRGGKGGGGWEMGGGYSKVER